jgi:DNA-binding XRE family transcriptional regulator
MVAMTKNIKFDDYIKEQSKDPIFKEQYTYEKNKMTAAMAIYETRAEIGWTQRELAEKADVPQSTVARIEKGNNVNVDTLNKLAGAMGKQLKISVE